MNKKIIYVTQTDINNGTIGDPYTCPIALAMQRELDIPKYSIVVGPWVLWGDRRYDLPEDAQAFIEGFDEGRAVKPFEFIIDLDNYKPLFHLE